MLQAKVFDAEGYRGTITWTGSRFVLRPADSQLLNNLLKMPVFVPLGSGEGQVDVYADKDPVLFMTHLFRHYKSYALNVSEAKDPDDPNDSGGESESEGKNGEGWRPLPNKG